MSVDLRLGRWQDVLADVECDTLIVDAPYSERTHSGHNDGTASANRVTDADERRLRVDKRNGSVGKHRRRALNYSSWSPTDVGYFVGHWSARTRGWLVSITDHVLAPAWTDALEARGRYVFPPLHFMQPGSRVRITGDGPSLWTTTIVVARPRAKSFLSWGALPGGYVLPPEHNDRSTGEGVIGGKPLWLMRALVRDYSRPGDLVCDPCAGGGTTLLAALIEGRRAVGAECLPEHYEIARKRIARGFTPTLFQDAPPAAEQLKIGGVDE